MKYRNSKESNRNMFTAEEEEQLQKRKDEYMSGWQQCLESVRASLRDYPNGGGDIEVMAEVDRLIKKAQETEKEIQELSNKTSDTDKFYCLDCGCQCTGDFWVGNTDARRLCKLCKEDRSRRLEEKPMLGKTAENLDGKSTLNFAQEAVVGWFVNCVLCHREMSADPKDDNDFYTMASKFGNNDPRVICSSCFHSILEPTVKTPEVVPESKFTFTHATLMTFMQGIMALAVEQAERKNKDYASTVVQGTGSTGLANFYETSRRCGGTPLHAIAVHRLKHELSIEKMLRGEELESEPIMGRIIDAINYNVLALALYIETRQDMELLNQAADKMAMVGVTLYVGQ